MHNIKNYRASWAPHGEDVWYTGPAMEHYRYYKAYIPKTRAELIPDTVECFTKTIHMPHMSSMDATYHAAENIICALHNPEPVIPLVKLDHGHREALKTLANIFKKANTPTVPPRVPVREVGKNKLQEMNQEGTQMKRTLK